MLQAVLDGGVVFLALVVLGAFIGLVVGVLPGLTFVMGVLLILPFTYSMDPANALVLMIAVYVAGTYGGALTAILLNIPGEPNDVPLTRDGHTMARRGRAARRSDGRRSRRCSAASWAGSHSCSSRSRSRRSPSSSAPPSTSRSCCSDSRASSRC